MKTRKPYPTDLSDAQWSILEPFIPSAKAGGRPETYPKREILNAIFYVVRRGIAWRMPPHEFPPYGIVFHYFRQGRLDGTWSHLNELPSCFEGALMLMTDMPHQLGVTEPTIGRTQVGRRRARCPLGPFLYASRCSRTTHIGRAKRRNVFQDHRNTYNHRTTTVSAAFAVPFGDLPTDG